MNDSPDHRTKATIITDHYTISVCHEHSARRFKHIRHQYTSDLQAPLSSLFKHLLHLRPAHVPTQNCPSSRHPAAAMTSDIGSNDVICEKWHRRLGTSRAAGRSAGVATRCSVDVRARHEAYAGKPCKACLSGELAVSGWYVRADLILAISGGETAPSSFNGS